MQCGVELWMHSIQPGLLAPVERQHWNATYNNVRLICNSESLRSPPEQHSQRLAKVLYTSRSTPSNRSERLSASTFRPLHTSGELHLTSIRCLWRCTYCCASATCLGRFHTTKYGRQLYDFTACTGGSMFTCHGCWAAIPRCELSAGKTSRFVAYAYVRWKAER